MVGNTNAATSRKYINDQNELGAITSSAYTGEITASYDGFISALTSGDWTSVPQGVWSASLLVNNRVITRFNGNVRSGDGAPYVTLGPVPVKKGDILKLDYSPLFANHFNVIFRNYDKRDYSDRT